MDWQDSEKVSLHCVYRGQFLTVMSSAEGNASIYETIWQLLGCNQIYWGDLFIYLIQIYSHFRSDLFIYLIIYLSHIKIYSYIRSNLFISLIIRIRLTYQYLFVFPRWFIYDLIVHIRFTYLIIFVYTWWLIYLAQIYSYFRGDLFIYLIVHIRFTYLNLLVYPRWLT